ncbi:MAG: hypothetical protein HQ528_06950 [Candidatus Marinimicrobia bacterium]|nr:hypothetical protein [Candidatus Neomarinimicrobiota bacterium]
MKTIWVLVLVKKGFIIEPEIFYSEKDAEKRKEELMADFNKDYDEIEIFKNQIA